MRRPDEEYDVTEEICVALAQEARLRNRPLRHDPRIYNENLTGRDIEIRDKDGNVISVTQTKGVPKPKGEKTHSIHKKNLSIYS